MPRILAACSRLPLTSLSVLRINSFSACSMLMPTRLFIPPTASGPAGRISGGSASSLIVGPLTHVAGPGIAHQHLLRIELDAGDLLVVALGRLLQHVVQQQRNILPA